MKTIIITEKTSQKKDLAAAIGNKYGTILAAEGHLVSLQEPQQVRPDWGKWSYDLLKPDDFYPTCPAPDASPSAQAKLKAIEEGLRHADKVILATDCDREGQLIGEELLRHFNFNGPVERAMFTAQDEKTLREAFQKLEPNDKYFNLGQAAIVRQQSDQVYNLSLTRAATVGLKQPGDYGAIGIGRVKTPTMALVCIREQEILNFTPTDYFNLVATATTDAGVLQLKHAPKDKITEPEQADALLQAAQGYEGPLKAVKSVKKKKPPKLLDLPELQKICSRKWGWTANKTLDVAQELYDGDGKKIQTYPRAESRYLSENQIADVGDILSGLTKLSHYSDLKIDKPQIRKGKAGHFSDAALKGVSHHAIVPNKNTMDKIHVIYPRLSDDEKKMFDLVASSYLAVLMPDYEYENTTITMDVPGPAGESLLFKITGNIPKIMGWKAVYTDVMEKKEEDAGELPPVKDGDLAKLDPIELEAKKTKAPPRFNEGSLIDAMQNAWKFVEDKEQQEKLKEAKGIGTPATRAAIIAGLKAQNFLTQKGKNIVPTHAGMTLYNTLRQTAPALVDPGVTAIWEMKMDGVLFGEQTARDVWDEIGEEARRLINIIQDNARHAPKIATGVKAPKGKERPINKPTDKMLELAKKIANEKSLKLPKNCAKNFDVCREFLDEHLSGKVDPRKAILQKLSSGEYVGINEKTAQSILDAFDLEAVNIIENEPDKLSAVPGITPKKVEDLKDGIQRTKEEKSIADFLRQNGVVPFHAKRIQESFPGDGLALLQENPYHVAQTCPSLAIGEIDKIANRLSLDATDLNLKASRDQALVKQALLLGPQDEALLKQQLGCSEIPNTVGVIAEQNNGKWDLIERSQARRECEELIGKLHNGAVDWPALDTPKAIQWAEGQVEGKALHDDHKIALQQALTHKCTRWVKRPGSDITAPRQALCAILSAKKISYLEICPNQTQAKALAEDALSYAKALEWHAKSNRYKRTADNPLKASYVIIHDGFSLRPEDLRALLRAIPTNAGLLFIETDQAEEKPIFEHNLMLPISMESARVQIAENLRRGEGVRDMGRNQDFYFIASAHPRDTMAKLQEIVARRLPKGFNCDPIDDIQMVLPGDQTGKLNSIFQDALNPKTDRTFVERFGQRYRNGDKIVWINNDPAKNLMAGEIGKIKTIDPPTQTLTITVAGRNVKYAFDDLDRVQLGYALPYHLALTLSSPYVVVPYSDLNTQHDALLRLLSRAQKCCVFIGPNQ